MIHLGGKVSVLDDDDDDDDDGGGGGGGGGDDDDDKYSIWFRCIEHFYSLTLIIFVETCDVEQCTQI